ncbi:hypothetical protein TNCT_416911 [Trichonephila clavata]|uniref:Uncharacterized protein n=1 Tax=Trichonephila clavata TaxID=2740835 RepID=A0A8X6J464_TRICU|nr:hypothetical protein TNCT_416911 [Trichonephila clavata]
MDGRGLSADGFIAKRAKEMNRKVPLLMCDKKVPLQRVVSSIPRFGLRLKPATFDGTCEQGVDRELNGQI